MLKITAHDNTLQTNAQSIHSTANQHGRFRTYQVVDGNGRVFYEADPAELDNPQALAEARADCQDYIDNQ